MRKDILKCHISKKLYHISTTVSQLTISLADLNIFSSVLLFLTLSIYILINGKITVSNVLFYDLLENKVLCHT